MFTWHVLYEHVLNLYIVVAEHVTRLGRHATVHENSSNIHVHVDVVFL